jgi:hypothetical protein
MLLTICPSNSLQQKSVYAHARDTTLVRHSKVSGRVQVVCTLSYPRAGRSFGAVCRPSYSPMLLAAGRARIDSVRGYTIEVFIYRKDPACTSVVRGALFWHGIEPKGGNHVVFLANNLSAWLLISGQPVPYHVVLLSV